MFSIISSSGTKYLGEIYWYPNIGGSFVPASMFGV